MKTAEEYFNDFCLPSNDELLRVKYDVKLLITRAQIDAIMQYEHDLLNSLSIISVDDIDWITDKLLNKVIKCDTQ